jgi:hypothetical protein
MVAADSFGPKLIVRCFAVFAPANGVFAGCAKPPQASRIFANTNAR